MLLRFVIVELHLTSLLVMREQLSLHISIPPLLLYSHHVFGANRLSAGHEAARAPVHSLSSGITASALFGAYLYTPYSLVVSTMALTFSGFA